MNKPKICFVASSPFTVNAFLKAHITALSHEFDVTVMTALEDKLATLSLPDNVHVISLNISRHPSPLKDLATLFHLWRRLSGSGYRAVLSITPKAGLLAMLASFMARVPHRLHCFTGQVWATKHGIKRCLLKLCDRLIVALATRIFADGRAQAQYLIEQEVAAAQNIEVLGPGPVCGVNAHRFKADAQWHREVREQYDLPAQAIVGLFLGRLHRDKGILDLAAAFDQIMMAGNTPALYLLVVGPVDDVTVLKSLKSICARAKANLRMIDGVNDPERYFAAADFLILPSYREGFGMVVLEAAAAGLPAIVTDIYGLKDAVVENSTALVVPPHSPVRLAEAILQLSSDHELRQRMGSAAALRVAEQFSVEIVTTAWLKLFRDMLLRTKETPSR